MQKIKEFFLRLDARLIDLAQIYDIAFARFAIFLVYFWFGILKIFSLSPANPLVSALLEKTIPFLSFQQFILFFGIFEVVIGIIFLIPGFKRVGIFFVLVHLITTILPLFVLPAMSWQSFMVPTLEGQYIIKNVLIVALAVGIMAHLHKKEKRSLKIFNLFKKIYE